MARAGGGLGSWCTYKKTTIVLCSINIIVVLYLLRYIYASIYLVNYDARTGVKKSPDHLNYRSFFPKKSSLPKNSQGPSASRSKESPLLIEDSSSSIDHSNLQDISKPRDCAIRALNICKTLGIACDIPDSKLINMFEQTEIRNRAKLSS